MRACSKVAAVPRMFATVRDWIKAAAPAPPILVMGNARADRDRADVHVARVDQPAFSLVVVLSAKRCSSVHFVTQQPKGTLIVVPRYHPSHSKELSNGSGTREGICR